MEVFVTGGREKSPAQYQEGDGVAQQGARDKEGGDACAGDENGFARNSCHF